MVHFQCSMTLPNARQNRATELEAIIERAVTEAMDAFVRVGRALKEIRDDRLYKELDYTSFEEYCRERWNFGRNFANKAIRASVAADLVGTSGTQIGYKQALELASLLDDPDSLREAWEHASANGGATVEDVRDAVRLRRQLVKEIEDVPAQETLAHHAIVMHLSGIRHWIERWDAIALETLHPGEREEHESLVRAMASGFRAHEWFRRHGWGEPG
jgi:hypothetical protein